MDIRKYLKKLGYYTIPSSFNSKINEWESWYRANVRNFHRYSIHNGKNSIRCTRMSLGMAKKVSEDMADLLLNEKVSIKISDDKSDKFVDQVLKSNNFLVTGNDYQERKCYTGTVAYIPYLSNLSVDEEGNIESGAIKINYVSAGNIFPLTWENGYISECAFVFPKTIAGKKYAHIQVHAIETENESSQYVIYNHIVECTAGSGRELDVDEIRKMKVFQNLALRVQTGSDKRQFVIDRLNITNNIDEDNPMGIALFANSIDQLKGCDITYDSYINEFVLGRKRIFVAPDMLSCPELGDPVFDPNDAVFYQLPEEYTKKNGEKPIVEVNMEIRAEEHSKGVDDNIKLVSFKCGFGTERYRFDKGTITTATEVISSNSDMYRTIKKHEIILNDVLIELIQIIIRLGNVLHYELNEEADINIDFDDSIIEDTEKERENDRKDIAFGAFTVEEYRARWRNESIEEARKKVITEEENPDEE